MSKIFLCCVVAQFLMACSNTPDTHANSEARNSIAGTSSIYRSLGDAPEGSCVSGGVQLEHGLDYDNDGDLDEVLGAFVVCHGETGDRGPAGINGETPDILFASTALEANSVCPYGGTRLLIGIDANHDDVLDTNDVQSTSNVCHGSAGDQGPQGARGETGDQGLQGERGETGDQGPQGQPGATGDQGLQGERGATGDQGPQGERGETGDQGIQGERGETGAQGSAGEKGDTGAQGSAGEKGDTGDQGPAGV